MTKKIAELSPEEQEAQRKIWRESRQKSREAEKLTNTASANDWTDTFSNSVQYRQLRQDTEQFAKKVGEELGRDVTRLEETLQHVLWTLASFKKNLIKRVTSPSGELFGGMHFADVLGRSLVRETHVHDLEKSPKYRAAYRELLGLLDRRYGENVGSEDPIERESAIAIKEELAAHTLQSRFV